MLMGLLKERHKNFVEISDNGYFWKRPSRLSKKTEP